MKVDVADVLTGWFAEHGRDLPWRSAQAGPWGVLVSEFMLQQTPVARVLPVYAEWMARWPTPAALAAERSGEAVRAWGKLGYPRRALRLHECANQIVERFAGAVPAEVEQLMTLPGVGTYTARAVAAFAFGAREPVVDTNVRRVVARMVQGRDATGSVTTAADLAATESLLPESPVRAVRTSAALMELGALVCTARAPRCHACPVAARCRWLSHGRPAPGGPPPRAQRYAGTDRQVRGLLMDVLRASHAPIPRSALDAVWGDGTQRERALGGLVRDGLAVEHPDGRFALPG